jgi:hypothetical protein
MMDSITNLSPGRGSHIQSSEYLNQRENVYNLEKKSKQINLNSSYLSNMSNNSKKNENNEKTSSYKDYLKSTKKEANKNNREIVCPTFRPIQNEQENLQNTKSFKNIPKIESNTRLGCYTTDKYKPPRNENASKYYMRNIKNSSQYNFDYSKDYDSINCNGADKILSFSPAFNEEEHNYNNNDNNIKSYGHKLDSERTRNRTPLYSYGTDFSNRITQSIFETTKIDKENKISQTLHNLDCKTNIKKESSYSPQLEYKKNIDKEIFAYKPRVTDSHNENLHNLDFKNYSNYDNRVENEMLVTEVSKLLGVK